MRKVEPQRHNDTEYHRDLYFAYSALPFLCCYNFTKLDRLILTKKYANST